MHHNIIFDLDDTLFDTQGQLIAPAMKESCAAMIEAGMPGSIEACLSARENILKYGFRNNIFEKLVRIFGTKNGIPVQQIVQAGEQAFYKRDIKEKIQLFPDTQNVLSRLQKSNKLFLVTLGDPTTQEVKVNKLEVNKYFEKIYYVDILTEKSKQAAFKEILQSAQPENASFISIGNRIDTDIGPAKALGMKTVLFLHGEYLSLKAKDDTEVPDHKVKSLTEFESWLTK